MKGFFMASKYEAKDLVKGDEYYSCKYGAFKNKNSVVLEVKKMFTLTELNSFKVVEVNVPENSVIKYPTLNRFSFGACSGAIIVDVCSWEMFEQKQTIIV